MKTNIENTELTPIQVKRELLKKYSSQVADLVESGEYATVNEAIVNSIYKNDLNTDFKTFNKWKSEGFIVKKGEKAFLVWGRPKEKQEAEQGKEPTTDDDHKFFPLAFLFSNAQIQKI